MVGAIWWKLQRQLQATATAWWKVMVVYCRVDGLSSPVGDYLYTGISSRAQRSVTSMGELYLLIQLYENLWHSASNRGNSIPGHCMSPSHQVCRIVIFCKWWKTATWLLQTTDRNLCVACQSALLSDFQGRGPVAVRLKCLFIQLCSSWQ